MALQRRTPLKKYTDQEKQVLLTGVPLHAASTRFGYPYSDSGGWKRDEIEAAWDELKDELLELWQTPKYEHHRQRHQKPFAERYLSA